MIDHSLIKLGKHKKREDARSLKLARYLAPALPPAPPSTDWTAKVNEPWRMMLNDSLGDCTCAAAGHLIMEWTCNAGVGVLPTDDQILEAYEAITGYNPADPNSDQGAVELDVLNYWRQTGIAGHQIGAFAEIDPANQDHVKAAVYLFGGVYIGVQLPLSAQGQDEWNVVGPLTGDCEPGSWGGHAVPVVAYDENGVTVITWGQPLKMSWAFWSAYVDEAYAIISADFLNGAGDTPAGFDLAQLQNDLRAVEG